MPSNETTPTPLPIRNEFRLYGACPSFFQALVYSARQGGRESYATAAHELARHAYGLVRGLGPDPDSVTESLSAAADDNAEAVVEWMKVYLPKCMALVPRRRLPSFTKGVELAIEDELVGV